MQLMIEIDDKLYTRICLGKDMSEEENDEMGCIIANGIRLPNRHGRLIDGDALKCALETITEWNGDVHRYVTEKSIDDAPTIIEADKEDKDD